MARRGRWLACGLLAASLFGLLHTSSSTAMAKSHTFESLRLTLAHEALTFLITVIRLVFLCLPGLLVAFVYQWLFPRPSAGGSTPAPRRLSKKAIGGGFVAFLLLLVLSRPLLGGQPAAPSSAPEAAPQSDSEPLAAMPHSGEEVLMSDGNFVRLPDPSKTSGEPVDATWRQGLSKALVTAIARGEEQVVIMFTRQGCPWCDRQLPVLQDAIRSRAELSGAMAGAGAAMGGAGAAFVAGGGPGDLLNAPLRVFVMDADEFPQLIQQFGVEAFPTNIVFGRPRVPPLMSRGYLDEDQFSEICRQAALAEPEPEEGAAPPRRKQKRRFGLFR